MRRCPSGSICAAAKDTRAPSSAGQVSISGYEVGWGQARVVHARGQVLTDPAVRQPVQLMFCGGAGGGCSRAVVSV
jgi:hypothetical protein